MSKGTNIVWEKNKCTLQTGVIGRVIMNVYSLPTVYC